MAQTLDAGIAHGAPAPAEQQQQPAASKAAGASASAKVRAAKSKAPAGADLAGPCTEKLLSAPGGWWSERLFCPHLGVCSSRS